jgi:energy-coupling factor transport system permease protein
MNPFSYYEVDSWLHRRNPTAKVAAHLVLSLLLTIVFDPFTPLAFLVLTFAVGRTLGHMPLRTMLKALVPFWLIAASLMISNALFANHPEKAIVLWRGGPFVATIEGAMIGLSLAERSMTVATFSVLLMMSTDPTDLVRSLVQQAHLPQRFAYPALAAYRFLPLLQTELETIRLAHRLRGVGRRRGPLGWLREQGRLAIPLLANAIRRSERVALAMDARGFAAQRTRTHYRQIRFDAADWWVIAMAAMVGSTIVLASARLGVLRIWSGTLGA